MSAIVDRPLVVAIHHHQVPLGIPLIDAYNLRNRAKLLERLSEQQGPVWMILEHVHRAEIGEISSVTCQITPAPCHVVAINHRRRLELGLVQ